jgi:flavin reductase (DIM6/NTAB) family NADH-FMN oxidoreductase RutF
MSARRTFDPVELESNAAYHLLNAVVAPRPIAWISTLAPDGTANLAPHSYPTVASPDPPVVCFTSVGRKDTLRNVESLPEFVYNIGTRSMVERINRTAANFPGDVSEFEWAGLTPIPSERIQVPRVAEAPVQLECRVVAINRILESNNYMILGQVMLIHLAQEIMRGDRVDTAALDPVSRLAGSLYSELGKVFSLERPTWQSLQESAAAPLPKSDSG